MTSEDMIRLDQRVLGLESTISTLQARVNTLESSLSAANTKVETLNAFYGQALGDTTSRLMGILDKVTGATTPTA